MTKPDSLVFLVCGNNRITLGVRLFICCPKLWDSSELELGFLFTIVIRYINDLDLALSHALIRIKHRLVLSIYRPIIINIEVTVVKNAECINPKKLVSQALVLKSVF